MTILPLLSAQLGKIMAQLSMKNVQKVGKMD